MTRIDDHLALRQLERALAGQEPELGQLIDRLTPVVQARVARTLLATPRRGQRAIREWVEDLTQDVFLTLFADGGRVLRDWSPQRGLSLENFVGLVARRRALSMLRTQKRQPWKEEPTEDDDLDTPDDAPDPEASTASRQVLGLVLERLQEELSPLGWRVFELLFVRESEIDEVSQQTGLEAGAVYAWRSRLKRLSRRLLGELLSEPGASPRIALEDET